MKVSAPLALSPLPSRLLALALSPSPSRPLALSPSPCRPRAVRSQSGHHRFTVYETEAAGPGQHAGPGAAVDPAHRAREPPGLVHPLWRHGRHAGRDVVRRRLRAAMMQGRAAPYDRGARRHSSPQPTTQSSPHWRVVNGVHSALPLRLLRYSTTRNVQVSISVCTAYSLIRDVCQLRRRGAGLPCCTVRALDRACASLVRCSARRCSSTDSRCDCTSPRRR